jgi:hypothetical protein
MNTNEPAPAARKSWPRRHKIITTLGALGALIVIVTVASALAGSPASTPNTTSAASPSASPSAATPVATTAPAPAPAPVPSPNAKGRGSCDVSLSSSIDGTSYLVSVVDITNTGNIGQMIRVRVAWPQVGFAPIVQHKLIRVPFGKTVHANLHVAADPNGADIIGNFQTYQLSHLNGDPCDYTLTEVSTFGAAH